jgi:hypothetical protein
MTLAAGALLGPYEILAPIGAKAQRLYRPLCAHWICCSGLKSDAVVHSLSNSLFASEVSLRCLDRDVTKQELDLFQLSSRKTA